MISLMQHAYIDTILNLMDANTVRVPMELGLHLSQGHSPSTTTEKAEMAGVPYHEVVGLLMYAALGTCPNMASATVTVSQFMQDPGKVHWEWSSAFLGT